MAKLKRPVVSVASSSLPAASEAGRGRRKGLGDPRWLLQNPPKLTPALKIRLLTGRYATVRIAGWVDMAIETGGVNHGDRFLRTAWAHYGPTLIAEARAAGFEAAGLSGPRPKGPKVEAWRAAYQAAHRY